MNWPTLVRDFLECTAQRLPGKTALVCGDRRVTYAEVDSMANRVAQALRAHGVQRGDRVVIHLTNGLAAVVAIFATLKSGAVFVPVNATAKADKVGFILQNCRATALVTDLKDTLPESPWLKLVVDCGAGANQIPALRRNEVAMESLADIFTLREATRPPRINSEDDLACLIYTSGSTGRPKGVMCEHRNVVFASGSIIEYLRNAESDIVLNALPLSFDYGLYQLLMTFRFGGTLVLEDSFAYPAVVLQRIAEERVTGLPGVPTFFSLLLRQKLAAYDLSSLRYLTNTAAALPPSHVLELRARFPGARLYSMYGLTETKRTLYLPPEELERRAGSVGIPIPGTEAWLEDQAGRRIPPGRIGELVIRGRHVMRGYWENSVATAHRFRPGRAGERLCYSGDLFRQDAEGYFYFVGRKDDIIKSRGEKVAPKEVENVLFALPGVVEAAVLGVPDPVLGQAVKAYLVCRGTLPTATRVQAHCRAHLEDFMVPREVEFRDSLPKNASGKIDKLALARPNELPRRAGHQVVDPSPPLSTSPHFLPCAALQAS
jgi:long-chain acyl-CoA synthetase